MKRTLATLALLGALGCASVAPEVRSLAMLTKASPDQVIRPNQQPRYFEKIISKDNCSSVVTYEDRNQDGKIGHEDVMHVQIHCSGSLPILSFYATDRGLDGIVDKGYMLPEGEADEARKVQDKYRKFVSTPIPLGSEE